MTKTGEAAQPPIEIDADTVMDTIRANTRELAIGGIVLLVAIGGYLIWQQGAHKKSENADLALASPAQAFFAGNMPLAKNDLIKLVDRYVDTPAGVEGSMMLAEILFTEGKIDDGLKRLTAAKSSSAAGPFAAPLEALTGEGYLDAKKYDLAVQAYQSAAEKTPFAADKDVYRADAARALTLAGKVEDAKKIWTELADKQDSPMTGEAKIRLGELLGRK